MTDTKTRKAIVTLADVQEAFKGYAAVRSNIGMPVTGHSFDRGARGKGFAQYDQADGIVRTFDTKEDAHIFYSRYVEVAQEVMHAPAVTLAESTQEAPEAPEGTQTTQEASNVPQSGAESATVPTQRRRRVSQEAK